MRQEPLVPLGLILTVSALVGAGRALRANDHVRANIMFRRRVYAQGFTLLCVCAGGLYWSKDHERRKEFERLEREKAAADKRERWLAELQARDDEDNAARDRVGLLKEKRRQREEAMREKVRAEGEEVVEKGEESGKGLVEQASRLWTGGKRD
jgi:hypothetical protein